MIRRETPEDDGVSEVIGYVVILGTILISVGLVLGQGFPALQHQQEFEHTQNTQQAFGILQNNLNEVVERQVPARATEVRMMDSTLRTTEKLYIGVNESTPPSVGDFDKSRAITYEHSGDKLVYENGAVLATSTSSNGGASMVRDPIWSLKQENPSIKTVEVPVDGDGNVHTGGSTKQVRGDRIDSQTGMNDRLYVSVDSPNADAWARYLERSESVAVIDDPREGATGTDGLPRVTARIEASDKKVVYTETKIRVDIR